MPDTTSLRWVSTELPEETHRSLLRRATELGLHPSDLIARYVEAGLVADAANSEIVDLKVLAGVNVVKRRRSLESQLRAIAQEHLAHPSEELSDLLHDLCAVAGMTVEDVLEDAGQYASTVPLIYDDGHGVASCEIWLQKAMRPGQPYGAGDIQDMAARAGFSESTLKTAKRELSITSQRERDRWVWVLPGPAVLTLPVKTPGER